MDDQSPTSSEVFYGHSNDLQYGTKPGARLEDVETVLGIRPLLHRLHQDGWDSYVWRNSRDGRTSFVELSGSSYSDFLRENSDTGVRHAVEALVNRVQAMQKCEQQTGHDFATRPGFDNGLLGCRHCRFGGYTSMFLLKSREADNWKMVAEDAKARLRSVATRLGVHFNISDEIMVENKMIPAVEQSTGHTKVGDTDTVFFEINREKETMP